MARTPATLLTLLVSCITEAQADPHRVPAGFQSVTEVHGYQVEDPQRLATPIRVDLLSGTGTEGCPLSAWTGAATFLNAEGGTVQYWGTGFWCLPIGFGTVQYPDGSTYFGMVTSYVASREAPLQRDQVRIAVREGYGQAYQPATGQQWLGEFRAGVLAKDLSQDGRFTAAYSAATASITDKAAPTFTPAIEALFDFEVAVAAAPAAAAPKPAGGLRKLLFGAFAGDKASTTPRAPVATARSGALRYLPAALQGIEGMAELDVTMERYAQRSTANEQQSLKAGFFSVKCLAAEGQDAVFGITGTRFGGFPSRGYIGEHRKCLPQGVGRIEYQNGDIWIGPVTFLKSQSESKGRVIPSFDTEHRFPMPDGLGYWYHAESGRAMVLSLRYQKPKGGVFFVAEWAGRTWQERFVAIIEKDGRVGVYDDRNPRDYRMSNILHETQVAHLFTWEREGTVHLPDGSTLRGRFQNNAPQTNGWGYTWQHAGLGITLHGQFALREVKGVERYTWDWKGPYSVEITKPYGSLAPGHYLGDAQQLRPTVVSWREGGLLLVPGLSPVSAQQYAGLVKRLADENQRMTASSQATVQRNHEQMLAQERAEAAEDERIRRAQQAERDAAFRAAMSGAMADLKQTVDQGVADLEASNRRSQETIAFANQLAAQQAEQERRNLEEQQRREREARAGEQAYAAAQAQSQANFRAAMDAAKQQQAQDAARLQQQTTSMQRQVAQGGAYQSPFETGASTTASTSSSGTAASAPRTRAPVPSECIVEGARKPGDKCGKPNSLSIEHRYVCGGKANVRVCLSTPTGDDCGSWTLNEGESIWYYVCEFTGGIKVSGTSAN